MKKLVILLLIFAFGCGVKQTRNYLLSGDYDSAINNAVGSLQNNKDRKGKQDYIYMLEEAFAKAKERDLQEIAFLKKENLPSKYEKIYNTYISLQERQEKIRPLLPLFLMKENRNAIFPFDDYSNEIVESKNKMVKYLYDNSKALIGTNNKMNYRRAYGDLEYINKLSPNYKDISVLMQTALEKGTDYVFVFAKNETNVMIPMRLQSDLLDFNTYGLNDKWTVYHNSKVNGLKYDFNIIVSFVSILISPEQIKEREFVKERIVKVGTKEQRDERGNIIKDAKGNSIMIDDNRKVTVSIYEFRQFKTSEITAKIDYIDLKTNQVINKYPLTSGFTFENIYSTYKGDRRAADDNYFGYFDNRAIPFPTNEQMIYNCGEDLKNKLKNIIVSNAIRN